MRLREARNFVFWTFDLRFRSLDALPAKGVGGILNYQAGWGEG